MINTCTWISNVNEEDYQGYFITDNSVFWRAQVDQI